jgi:hypothetical protein
MIKAIEFIIVLVLLVFAFFAGVKYSDSVKSHASWLFENKSEEVELPDLSNENNNAEVGVPVDENGENLNNVEQPQENQMIAPQDSTPMDDVNAAPRAAPVAGAPVKVAPAKKIVPNKN